MRKHGGFLAWATLAFCFGIYKAVDSRHRPSQLPEGLAKHPHFGIPSYSLIHVVFDTQRNVGISEAPSLPAFHATRLRGLLQFPSFHSPTTKNQTPQSKPSSHFGV